MPVDPRLLIEPDFVNLRMALVDDLDGDFRAAIVLQRLYWRMERSPEGYRATMQALADDVHMPLRTTERAVAKLIGRGYLVTSRADRFDATTVFKVILGGLDPAKMADSDPAKMADSDPAKMADSSYRDVKDKNETTPPTPSPDRFEEAWSHWPRKVGKKAALKAWPTAVRARGSVDDLILDVARFGAAYAQYPASRTEFIPHLSSWLNGERWTDPLPRARGAAGAVQSGMDLVARLEAQERAISQ